jgi:predicted nucleotidyltransferase
MTDQKTAAEPWAVTPQKIEEAVRRIVEAAHPAKVILFGSYARRQAGPGSDVDLLVVEDAVPDTSKEAARLYQCVRGLLMGLDILVVAREKFDYWKDTPGNVYYEAAQDGRPLYEAA